MRSASAGGVNPIAAHNPNPTRPPDAAEKWAMVRRQELLRQYAPGGRLVSRFDNPQRQGSQARRRPPSVLPRSVVGLQTRGSTSPSVIPESSQARRLQLSSPPHHNGLHKNHNNCDHLRKPSSYDDGNQRSGKENQEHQRWPWYHTNYDNDNDDANDNHSECTSLWPQTAWAGIGFMPALV